LRLELPVASLSLITTRDVVLFGAGPGSTLAAVVEVVAATLAV
jgi:hypothetical protein